MRILYFLISILTLFSCNNFKPNEQENNLNDSLFQKHYRDSIVNDSIYKSSPQYQIDLKKKEQLIKEFEGYIDNCYTTDNMSNKVFNMNKWESLMKKKGFTKGQYLGDFEGNKDGFHIYIKKGKSIPTGNGWKHNWSINCKKIVE